MGYRTVHYISIPTHTYLLQDNMYFGENLYPFMLSVLLKGQRICPSDSINSRSIFQYPTPRIYTLMYHLHNS